MKVFGMLVAVAFAGTLGGFAGGVAALVVHDTPGMFLGRDWHRPPAERHLNVGRGGASSTHCLAAAAFGEDLAIAAGALRQAGDADASQSYAKLAEMNRHIAAADDEALCLKILSSAFNGAFAADELERWRALAADTDHAELTAAADRVDRRYGVALSPPKAH